MVKTVAVIGAGISGVSAVKACAEEGLVPTCFDQRLGIGGAFRVCDNKKIPKSFDIGANIWSTINTNSSKEWQCFSDLIVPNEWPLYPWADQVREYLEMYVDAFKLRPYFKFSTKVVRISRAKDFTTTGRWVVTTQLIRVENATEYKEGPENSETFDAVMLASGYYRKQVWPDIPGLKDKFKGEVLHSGDYNSRYDFRDKRVLIIGGGTSAVDIATDVCTETRNPLIISMRSGTYLINRLTRGGRSIEYDGGDVFLNKMGPFTSLRRITSSLRNRILDGVDHYRYGIGPSFPFGSGPISLNSELPAAIACGRILAKRDVSHMTETGAVFEDGECREFDAVIAGTGFEHHVNYLEDECRKYSDPCGDFQLYKYTFPASLEHPTLAFIGITRLYASQNTHAELQSRAAVQVFKGNVKLPSVGKMLKDIKKKQKYLEDTYGYPNLRVLAVPTFADAADIAGVSPSLWRILPYVILDPKLAWRLMFGPYIPAHFRFFGPGANWEYARMVVMGKEEREWAATCRVTYNFPPIKRDGVSWMTIFGVSVVAAGVGLSVMVYTKRLDLPFTLR